MKIPKSRYFLFISLLIFFILSISSFSQAQVTYPAPLIERAFVWSMHNEALGVRYVIISRFTGPSPEDVESFKVYGPPGAGFSVDLLPRGTVRQLGLNWTWGTPWSHDPNQFRIPDGLYTFEVVDWDGRTDRVVTDFTYNGTVPFVDSASMDPPDLTDVGTTTPTLSFDCPADFDCQVVIRDLCDNTVHYLSSVTRENSIEIPGGVLPPNAAFSWEVRVFDTFRDPENLTWTQRKFLFTGTGGLLKSSEDFVISFDPINLYFLQARNVPVAPWDIDFVRVMEPDFSESYLTGLVCNPFEPDRHILWQSNGSSMPSGKYLFQIQDIEGNYFSETRNYVNNPVPIVDELSRVPGDNHYFSTTRPSFSWGSVNGAGTYNYVLYISDYFDLFNWVITGSTNGTSVTVPAYFDLTTGYTYKWRVFVYDNETDELINNGSFTPFRRTFTINPSIRGRITDKVTGEPIFGATVMVKKKKSYEEMETRHAGYYEFNDLEEGSWRVVVEADGYKKALAKVNIVGGVTYDQHFALKPLCPRKWHRKCPR